MKRAVLLFKPYPGLEIHRGEKILFGRFLKPHLVLSTCRVNGGLRSDLLFVANHQACEPKPCPGHETRRCLAVREPERYHQLVCEYHGLPAEKTALLGTAANMTLAGTALQSFSIPATEETLHVFCMATAGVETNAGRAGDPAQIYEWEGRFSRIEPTGTINLLIFINQELAPCALVRAVKMATEAKTSILQELNVPSRYSSGLATGTGTDQIAVSCLKTSRVPLRGAGKHVKLGELLAQAVREALREALARQNKRTPETIRYVPRLLERFQLGEDQFFNRLGQYLPDPYLTWIQRNREAVLSDTRLVAAVLAYIHLLDQISWKVVPEDLEILLEQAALVAVALSGKTEAFASFKESLFQNQDPLELLLAAMALGFREKWKVPYFDLPL